MTGRVKGCLDDLVKSYIWIQQYLTMMDLMITAIFIIRIRVLEKTSIVNFTSPSMAVQLRLMASPAGTSSSATATLNTLLAMT